MSAGTTTYGDINQRTAAWAATEMLSHAEPHIVLQKFATLKELPKNKAETVKFRRPIPFTAATTPLMEGITPTAQKMQYEDVQATLRQYGAVIEISDFVNDVSEDPVMRDASMLAGEQGALTVEMLLYGVIKAGTSVVYANGSARNQVNSEITLNKQRAVTRSLKAQKAKKITMILSSSVNYETYAVEASYVAFAHTDVESDIRALAGFVPTARYGTRQMVSDHEVGSVEDVRYVLSPELYPWADAGGLAATNGMVSTTGTATDVYPVLFIGREAYATVPLKGMRAMTPMVVNPKPSDSDPLAQRGKVSWKTYWAGLILNQNWMSRLEVGVHAL